MVKKNKCKDEETKENKKNIKAELDLLFSKKTKVIAKPDVPQSND